MRDFEPRLAWGGDLERGEEIYERLFPQALQSLKPGGYVVVEIGYNMRERVLALLGEEWEDIRSHAGPGGNSTGREREEGTPKYNSEF